MNKRTIPVETQVDLILPIFENFVKAICAAYGQKFQQDYTQAEHWLLMGRREEGNILKHHILTKYWDNLEPYFQGNTALFCFIEQPLTGLVNQDPKFWYFFSGKAATEYFNQQGKRPDGFSKENIFKFPVPSIQPELMNTTISLLKSDDLMIVEKLKKANEILQLSDTFLQQETSEKLERVVEILIIEQTRKEVEQLKKDIHDPGRSPASLEKRLISVFNICWRYLKENNELEHAYFKKLLTTSNEERTKGLNLARKKIGDFISKPENRLPGN